MADKYYRFFEVLLQLQKLVLQMFADQGIQGGEGLVHQQNIRVGGQGAGQTDPLLHSARKFAGVGFGPLFQTHQAELLFDDGPAGLAGSTGKLQPQAHILANGSPRHEGELLEHHGDPLGAQAVKGGAVAAGDVDRRAIVLDPHGAPTDFVQAVDTAQQG